jgi:hypothetical protein
MLLPPTKNTFNHLAAGLRPGIANVAYGSPVNGASSVRVVLRYMRADVFARKRLTCSLTSKALPMSAVMPSPSWGPHVAELPSPSVLERRLLRFQFQKQSFNFLDYFWPCERVNRFVIALLSHSVPSLRMRKQTYKFVT